VGRSKEATRLEPGLDPAIEPHSHTVGSQSFKKDGKSDYAAKWAEAEDELGSEWVDNNPPTSIKFNRAVPYSF
jgi:hypothetical protein